MTVIKPLSLSMLEKSSQSKRSSGWGAEGTLRTHRCPRADRQAAGGQQVPSWGHIFLEEAVWKGLPERDAVPEPYFLAAQLSPQCAPLAPVPEDSEESRFLLLPYVADL